MAIFIFPKGEPLEIQNIVSAVIIFERYGLYAEKMEICRVGNGVTVKVVLSNKPKR